MKTVTAGVVGIITSIVATFILMAVFAYLLRTAFGVDRYRDLGLPPLVIGGSIVGGAILGIVSFRFFAKPGDPT